MTYPTGWRGSSRPDRLGGPQRPLPLVPGELAEYRRRTKSGFRRLLENIAAALALGAFGWLVIAVAILRAGS